MSYFEYYSLICVTCHVLPCFTLMYNGWLEQVMEEYLDDYNQQTNKPMSLVLFDSAVEHIARISRIINQPYGNALLVGVGGSGRKSLTTLAVHIAGFDLFTIEITKSYGMADWREVHHTNTMLESS